MKDIILEEYFSLLNDISIQEQRIKLLELQLELNKQERYDEEEVVIKRIKELDL
ncbi:hypothetical protein VO178_09575 [Lysinibacillus fusiformis]|uniref:hypothetical protein n=1 Tax=Lysinibacillus fusiformis TaxID=28031 RepID=UPI002D79EC4B|nr:hypothetical protein [Lysinibacillus fusiformis]WRS99924.1 hypothetical protein VO178_09575 [Lysinibacillus fusiformis]